MPQKVYNNIEGSRVLDGSRVCEDVTSITPPTISHPTSTIKAAGMAADVDMPDTVHVEAMEFSVAHNNGTNCNYLATPGKHTIEARTVRQRYNVAAGEIEHESVKWRITGVHKSTDKGTIEQGNPYGSTDKYSVLRYEEIIDGTTVVLIDAMTGSISYNGTSYTDTIENLLS